MKTKTIALLVPLLLLSACEKRQERTDATVSAAPRTIAPATTAPKAKEKVRLEISEMGIDDQGYFQVKVQNNTSVSLDLINISWFFYDQSGNKIMKGAYVDTVITSKVKGSPDSTVVGPGESKIYFNPLITVERIFGTGLGGVGSAEIMIFVGRSALDALNLGRDSSIKGDEDTDTIRQVFQSSRFPLRSIAIPSTTLMDEKDTPIPNISPEEKEKLKAIYDSAPARRDAVDKALSQGKPFTRVSQKDGEATKLEDVLKKQGWAGHTVTDGIREKVEGGYLYKLEIIVDDAVDYYVVLKTDESLSEGTVVSKSKGSPWSTAPPVVPVPDHPASVDNRPAFVQTPARVQRRDYVEERPSFRPQVSAERKTLGWIDISSLQTVLAQFGYRYTVRSGYKTPQDDATDGPGWYITVRCVSRENVEYNGSLWVSDDWQKGRVISMRRRE